MKKIVYLLILAILIIVACLIVFFVRNFSWKEIITNSNCIKAGEVYQSPAVLGKIRGECCANLTVIGQVLASDCPSPSILVGGNSICSACGNGHCEWLWENKCNCPEDCK